MVGGGTPVGSQGRRAGHLQLQGTGAAYGQRKCGGRPHARRGSACPARIHGGGTCTMWCFWHGERRLRGSVALGGQRMSSAFLSCVGRVEGFLAGHAACGMRSASLEVRQNCRLKAVNWFCSDSSPWPRGDVHCMVRFWAFNASVSIQHNKFSGASGRRTAARAAISRSASPADRAGPPDNRRGWAAVDTTAISL